MIVDVQREPAKPVTVDDVMRGLHAAFEKRSQFLEQTLRTKRIAGSPLERVLQEPEWRRLIVRALPKYAPLSSPRTDPSPAQQGRGAAAPPVDANLANAGGEHVEASMVGGTDKKHDPPTRTKRPGDSASRHRQYDKESTSWNPTDELVKRFVRQQLMYLLLRLSGASTPEGGSAMSQGEILEAWLDLAPREILSFCDATVLELLSGRLLAGDVGNAAFDENVTAARELHYADCKEELLVRVAEGKDTRVPARGAIEIGLLRHFYVDSEHGSPFWRVLQKWTETLDAVGELLSDGERLIRWSHRLFEAVRELLSADGELSASLMAGTRPTGGQSWFYEPDRLTKMLEAAKHLRPEHRDRSSSPRPPPPNGERDRKDADTIDLALDLFQEACLDHCAAEGRTPTAATSGDSEKKSGCKSAGEAFRNAYFRRLALQRVWWRALAGDDEGARDLAEMCGRALPEKWEPLCVQSRDLAKENRCDAGTPYEDRTHRRAIVFGAGIAGLTAAHELADRNFEVHVIETAAPVARPPWTLGVESPGNEGAVQVGGVARTQWDEIRSMPEKGRSHLSGPGEHGYRLFPSFYRHVFDTMERTPLRNPAPGTRPTAFDQLEPTYRQVFARRERFVPLGRARPRTLEAFRVEYMSLTQGLGFSRRDLTRFFFKLLRYAMTCSARRQKEYEKISLWKFFGADQEGFYSEKLMDALRAAPQALVAMDVERCDARTQGNVYLQLLMDQVLGGRYTDSVLSGPTSHAWFGHWREHLKGLGVKFHRGELLTIAGDHGVVDALLAVPPQRVQRLEERIPDQTDYFVVAVDVVSAERVTRRWDIGHMPGTPHDGVPRELRGFTSHVRMALPGKLDRYEVAITFTSGQRRFSMSTQDVEDKLVHILRRVREAKDDPALWMRETSVFRSVSYWTGEVVTRRDEPDEHWPTNDGVPEIRLHAWFKSKVGPAEVRVLRRVIEKWLGGKADVRLTSEDPQWFEDPVMVRTPRLPADRYGESAQDRLQTFTGVQYYFEQDFKLVRGHVYFPDTEWGLSAVSQSQFWPAGQFPDRNPSVRGVLSVDVGDCRRVSSYTRKSVMTSSPEEIQEEVWRQIKDSLRTTRGPAAMVTSLPLPEPIAYHLDSNLRFAGAALRGNRTPFLINNVGDWNRRPRCLPWVPGRSRLGDGQTTEGTGLWQAPHGGYRVHEDHVVFCGSYMRTFTRMTTMEAANESARHAVNAILDHYSSTYGVSEVAGYRKVTGDYCKIWDLEEEELEDLAFFKRVDEMLFAAGKPHIADILQLDKIADVQHPETTPAQGLLAAIASTWGKDWGLEASEVAGSVNGLLQMIRGLGKDTGPLEALGGAPPNIGKLLAMLGIGKGAAGRGEQ